MSVVERPQLTVQRRGDGNPVAIPKAKATADCHALDVAPMIMEICSNGKVSFGKTATEFKQAIRIGTARGVPRWHVATVSIILKHAANLLSRKQCRCPWLQRTARLEAAEQGVAMVDIDRMRTGAVRAIEALNLSYQIGTWLPAVSTLS
jgi:hypothetical protein